MNARKRLRKSVVAVVALWSLLLSVQMAFATQPAMANVTFQEIPGVGGNASGTSGSVTLTCGWHLTCKSPYPSGTGVDWSAGDGATVYLRAKVFNDRAGTATKTFIAKVYGSTFSGGCHQIIAEIWAVEKDLASSADDTHMMDLRFMHATPTTSGTKTFSFNGSVLGTVGTAAIGKVVSDKNVGSCGWNGFHLHSDQQEVGGHVITRNTTDIPNAAPACPPDQNACNTFKTGGSTWSPPADHWERKIGWLFCWANCNY